MLSLLQPGNDSKLINVTRYILFDYIFNLLQFINSLTTIEYLRDEMLDMEVEKFELLEDVLVLEARLLKYQQVSKQYEVNCCC